MLSLKQGGKQVAFIATFLKDFSPMVKISSGRGFSFFEHSRFRGKKEITRKKKIAYIFPFIISLVRGSRTGLTGL